MCTGKLCNIARINIELVAAALLFYVNIPHRHKAVLLCTNIRLESEV